MAHQQEDEFARGVARFQRVMATVDEVTHVVLKGHLLRLDLTHTVR